jgi:acetylornithine deacetylase/succinyl-diaminopimelate desuccinylase-like protein
LNFIFKYLKMVQNGWRLPGILFVSFLLCNPCTYGQVPDLRNDFSKYKDLAREVFKELIEINTTSSFGSTRAAEAMASRLLKAGFPEGDVHIIGPDPLHKNLVVRYRGTGKKPPVLFICHLDVVQAYPRDWTVDPFTFIEKDGYFYGRGTTDIKCEAADLVTNLIRLRQEEFNPDRDIIVALTADEEGGNANGVNWLLTYHRELINAAFCINPDGGGGDIKNGKHTTLYVQTSEKIYASFELEAKNKGGHSSLPSKDNAIYRLAAGLLRIANYDFPVRLNETTRIILKEAADEETGQVKADLLTLLNNPDDLEAAGRIAGTSPYYNAMMRTTCVATMAEAGHAENALPQSAHATINCRLLPDDDPENVLSTLKEVVADTGLSVTCTYSSFTAPLSLLTDEVMEPVKLISASMWPGVNVLPSMSTGASDGRYLRRAGIPVYGISGMFGDPDDIRAHGQDERMGVNEFYEGVEFMYRFIKALL